MKKVEVKENRKYPYRIHLKWLVLVDDEVVASHMLKKTSGQHKNKIIKMDKAKKC